MTLGGGQVKESADVSYISHSLTLPCLLSLLNTRLQIQGDFHPTHVSDLSIKCIKSMKFIKINAYP